MMGKKAIGDDDENENLEQSTNKNDRAEEKKMESNTKKDKHKKKDDDDEYPWCPKERIHLSNPVDHPLSINSTSATTSSSSFSFSSSLTSSPKTSQSLVDLHAELRSSTARFLNHLAQNHSQLQISLTEEGFVESLVELLNDSSEKEDVRTAALSALSGLKRKEKEL